MRPSEEPALAIIPARGGSKGVPRKNLRDLAGVSLVGHAIEAAKRSNLVGEVVVSTDDADIARTARRHGARVIERPAALAGDEASSESALLHALATLGVEGASERIVAFLQCTSPLTLPEDIDGTIDQVRQGADSAFTAAPFHRFVWIADQNGARGVNHDPRARMRRQDRTPEWIETGAVYAFRIGGFLAHRHRFFGRIVMHAVPESRAWEIDTEDELNVVASLLRADPPVRRPWLKGGA